MTDHTPQEARDKVLAMIKDIGVATMVTKTADGSLTGRPMRAVETGEEGVLWFFSRAASGKTHDIEEDPEVLVSYAEPSDQNYVTINGEGAIVRDKALMAQKWSEPLRTWFPKGLDDPDICLIKVSIRSAEYWDSPSSAVVHAYGYVKARLTGEAPNPGDHDKVRFQG